MPESHPPLPPFTYELALVKVQAAKDAWNSRDPHRVSLVYTEDSEWRDRGDFVTGRDAIMLRPEGPPHTSRHGAAVTSALYIFRIRRRPAY